MEIRLATIDDAQAIYTIEQQSFSVPWSLESVLVELEGASNKLYMVICEENKIVGYAGAWLVYDEGQIMYRNLGFSVKGIRKDYYSEPMEDAYIMSLVSEEIE